MTISRLMKTFSKLELEISDLLYPESGLRSVSDTEKLIGQLQKLRKLLQNSLRKHRQNSLQINTRLKLVGEFSGYKNSLRSQIVDYLKSRNGESTLHEVVDYCLYNNNSSMVQIVRAVKYLSQKNVIKQLKGRIRI